jgi:hypothetical protein
VEGLSTYERGVDLLVGEYPLLAGVPGERGPMPERDILDIDERFLLALFVSYLVAGVARIAQDCSDRARLDGL